MKKVALLLVAAAMLPIQLPAAVVINEVYTGGGGTGAAFNEDYVELFNNGLAAVDIGGWVLSYDQAVGNGFETIIAFAPSTMIGAGESFVITAGTAGVVGAAVPTTFVGAEINFAGAGGQIQLVNGAATVQDLVGYGTATNFEGTGPAPAATTNLQSVQRIVNGVDTNNNNVDFDNLAANPVAVPEPSTYAMMGLGAALLVGMQRFRRRRSS